MRIAIAVLVLLAFCSCSRTMFNGEYKSLLTADPARKIVLIDYTGLGVIDGWEQYKYVDGSDITFVHIYCINNQSDSISENCIIECGDAFNCDLAIVCRQTSLESGQPLEYRSDYIVRTEDSGIWWPSTAVSHYGAVAFDVYETNGGEKISAFGVSVRINGVTIKDKDGLGYSNVNLTQAEASIRKARNKGLKNILGRLRAGSESEKKRDNVEHPKY